MIHRKRKGATLQFASSMKFSKYRINDRHTEFTNDDHVQFPQMDFCRTAFDDIAYSIQ